MTLCKVGRLDTILSLSNRGDCYAGDSVYYTSWR